MCQFSYVKSDDITQEKVRAQEPEDGHFENSVVPEVSKLSNWTEPPL